MKTSILLILTLVCVALTSCKKNEPQTYYDEPYMEVLKNKNLDASVERFFLDVNGDGEEELFVACSSDRDRHGNLFTAFQKSKESYLKIGIFNMTMIKLGEENTDGFQNINTWLQTDKSKQRQHGIFTRYRWNGLFYAKISSEPMNHHDTKAVNPNSLKWEARSGWGPIDTQYCPNYQQGLRNWKYNNE